MRGSAVHVGHCFSSEFDERGQDIIEAVLEVCPWLVRVMLAWLLV
jgi:hypothetical protein